MVKPVTNLLNSIANKILTRRALTIIICWILFISYELGMVYYVLGKLERPYIYIIYYIINISYFYVYLKILNRTFNHFKIAYIKGILEFVSLILLYLIVKGVADNYLSNQPITNNPYVTAEGFVQKNIFRALYFTVLATFYWSAGHISFFRNKAIEAERRNMLNQKEKVDLETQLIKSQNAYLQQQINPHMLFNTLNFVYNSVQRHSADAANCIWLLAEIMRFSLEETGKDGKILVDREVEQIENLVAINRYRYQQPLHILVEIKMELNDSRIIPLILLTLTENMFKHGNLLEENNPAELKLKVDRHGKLFLSTRNLKKSSARQARPKHLGMENVRFRLNNSYGEKNYCLQISEPDDLFELTLTLTL